METLQAFQQQEQFLKDNPAETKLMVNLLKVSLSGFSLYNVLESTNVKFWPISTTALVWGKAKAKPLDF